MSSRFEKGDNVIVISTNKIGTINAILARGDNYAYKVTIDGKTTTYQEKFLDPYINEEDEIIESWNSEEFATTEEFKIFQTWYRLKRPIEGDLYSFLASKTIFNQFQFKPLMKFISSGSEERLFIADEVGVGKTIETGIILTELLARGRISRKDPILIICPNTLGPKWQKEMKDRFNFSFKFHTPETLQLFLSSAKEGIITSEYTWSIVSLQTFRHKKYMSLLEEVRAKRVNDLWSMIVIDEAHHMRNSNTETNKLGHILSYMSEMMIMLSATPLNLKDTDLFNQMNILNPGMFPDFQTFQVLISPVKSINKCRRLLESKNVELYKEIIEEFETMGRDPLGELIFNSSVIKKLIEELKKNEMLSDRKIAYYSKLLISFSSFDQSFTRTLKREAFENRIIREPIKIGVDFAEKEMKFYNEVIEVVKEWYIEKGGKINALEFISNVPRRMATSCIPAMKDYLKWCVDNNTMLKDESNIDAELIEDDSELEKIEMSLELRGKFEILYNKANEIEGDDSKYREFSRAVKQMINTLDNKQIIVFSFFIRTLKYLKGKLESEGYKVGIVCGEMPLETENNIIGRYNVMKQFEDGELDILLSSDVGGEGLDFQFCQAMINYDLPYNPMKIEQRIGRIDRFGQKAEKIFIGSMYIKDTVDERIYDVLYNRIKLIEDSVGLIEPIIGGKITELQSEVISNKLSEEQLTKRIEDIKLAIEQGKLEMENFESNREELLGDEYFRKTIANMDNSDFVGPNDAMFLTEMCLNKWDNCSFLKEEETVLILLSKEIKNKINTYIKKPGCEGSSRELSKLVESTGKIKVIFNGSQAINHKNAHFLSPCGFWIKFLLNELEQNNKINKVFYAESKQSEIHIPEGKYIVPFYEFKTEGFRIELNLAAVPIDVDTLTPYKCDYIKLSRIISKALKSNNKLDDQIEYGDPSSYVEIGIEAVEEETIDKITTLREENLFRIQAKKKSLQEGSKVRCERLNKRIETHIENSNNEGIDINQDFIRLIDSQIENEKSNIREKIMKLDQTSELSVTTSLVAIMYLRVRGAE